jgi:hypothetical protein
MRTTIDETSITLFAEVLPFELTNGNDGRGSKWFSSARVRKKIEAQLRQLKLTREPFNSPVEVRVTRIVGANQRLWDSSSIGRGNWKEIEDAMVACGWFHDDSPKHIVETRFFQDDENRDQGPAIFVQIVERSAQ